MSRERKANDLPLSTHGVGLWERSVSTLANEKVVTAIVVGLCGVAAALAALVCRPWLRSLAEPPPPPSSPPTPDEPAGGWAAALLEQTLREEVPLAVASDCSRVPCRRPHRFVLLPKGIVRDGGMQHEFLTYWSNACVWDTSVVARTAALYVKFAPERSGWSLAYNLLDLREPGLRRANYLALREEFGFDRPYSWEHPSRDEVFAQASASLLRRRNPEPFERAEAAERLVLDWARANLGSEEEAYSGGE